MSVTLQFPEVVSLLCCALPNLGSQLTLCFYSFNAAFVVADMVKRNVRTTRSLLYHVKEEHPSDASKPLKITTRASQGPQT